MMIRRFVLALCAGLVCIQAASAQDIPADKRADIERLLAMTQAQAIAQQMSQAMVAQMTGMVRASNPDVPSRVLDVLSEAIDAVIEENMASLMTQMTTVYDDNFTHDDILALLEFYSSDIGRKFVAAQPAIARQSMAIGQTWGQSLGPQIQQRIQQRLQQEGFEL